MSVPPSGTREASSQNCLPDSILLAEDDPIFRHVLATWLKKWGYTVVAVENGQQAWAILQQDGSPQMMILDWMMPGIDGVELCERLRDGGLGSYRYVLLVTARDGKDDVVAGLDAGADDYLTKPFNADELRARLRAGRRILQLQDALLRSREALQFEATHDPLTGLWNRRAIVDILRREMQRHQRTGLPLGMMMADLDHFKRVNDSHGHLVGDAVLREFGRRLTEAIRSYDSAGRYGGEEFLIVVPGCTAAALASSADRIRLLISAYPIDTGVGRIPVTLSLGVVSTQTIETCDSEVLLTIADKVLYAAKAAGRDRVETANSLVEK
jgi:two-component system cell cycle response regulator